MSAPQSRRQRLGSLSGFTIFVHCARHQSGAERINPTLGMGDILHAICMRISSVKPVP